MTLLLQEAAERGEFLQQPITHDRPRNMGAILRTAKHIASAILVLHERGMVHGCLSGTAVMLQASEQHQPHALVSQEP